MNIMVQNRYNIFLSILIMILTISGCEKIEIGEPFDCRIGTKYKLTESLSFSIDSIRDYRCPQDMWCFWSGDVELFFNIHHNLADADTTIYLYTHNNNPSIIEGFTWRVLEVNPWLKSDQQINNRDYRIRVLIKNN
jgi:hypothetical protein